MERGQSNSKPRGKEGRASHMPHVPKGMTGIKPSPVKTVNFGEARWVQLAKSTLLTSTLVPLGFFQLF